MRRAVVSIPMTTRFRGITTREALLVQGPAGWGEFGPFLEYDDAEARSWWAAAAEAAIDGFPPAIRPRVPVNVTVAAVGPEAAMRAVRSSGGCTTAKVKVAEPGQYEADDLERLEAVRAALGPSGRVRIDVNGGWDVDTALARLPHYERAAGGLEYVEQPCPSVTELAEVRRRGSVPVAADESIRRSDDPLRVVAAEAADVVVLKVAPLGGVRACLRLAERLGLPVVVSSALETSVGLAAGVALAAALPELPYACGLATGSLLSGDVTADPMRPVEGQLEVRPVVVDEARLAALAAPADRSEWWERRWAAVTSTEAGAVRA
ncbi:MAG: o-succinylbenzoate synthase [bacterium]